MSAQNYGYTTVWQGRILAVMRIRFTQSGGFAGLVKGCRVDTAALAADERQRIEALVAESGLTQSCERFSETGRDLRQYGIRIERDAGTIDFICDEKCLPVAAGPLVRFLLERARPGRPAEPEALMPARGGSAAEGEWGRFEGDVVARWNDDGRDMTLVEPFAYVDAKPTRWEAPTGSVVNGASIPRPFWSLIGGPFEGHFRKASVVHDVACVDRSRPWQQVHRMFYEACRCGGVAPAKAKAMYYAVHHFGPRWSGSGRQLRDETPPPPTLRQAAAIARWFETHDVAAETIPTLVIE